MNMHALAAFLLAEWMENLAVVATVAGIWLTARRKLICWPVTLLADLLYLAVFYQARLFSDSLLQIFFVGFTLYGWWHWWRGMQQEGEVRVVPQSKLHMLRDLAVGALFAVLLGWLMERVGAALPHLDAALASFSLVASWWQARKHMANWLLWIAVDAIYVWEYHYKGLQPTALLYVGLIVLAVMGLVEWRRAGLQSAETSAATAA